MTLAKYEEFVHKASTKTASNYVPFPLISLNLALGDKRGLVTRRFHQIAGKSTTGKTTLSYGLIANAQKVDDRRCAIVDLEYRFNPEYAELLGVDLDRLDIIHALTAEQALTMAREYIRDATHSFISIDSVSMLVSEGELEKSFEDNANVREVSMIIDRFIKSTTAPLYHANAIVLIVNQMRANQTQSAAYVPDKIPGPNILWHMSDTILQLKQKEAVKLNGIKAGDVVQAMFVKNSQTGKKYGLTEYELKDGGPDVKADLLTLAIEHGIVEKRKAWFYHGEEKAQGEENAKALFDFVAIKEKLIEVI